MTVLIDEHDDEFLAVAGQAVRASGGAAALESLGWWDLLGNLDDASARDAVFALFRAQGRELASSPALGGITALPFLEGTGLAPGSVVAALRRQSHRSGTVWVVVGDLAGRAVLFADPDRGVHVVDPDAVELTLIEVPGGLEVHEAVFDLSARDALAGVDEQAWPRSARLGRVAAAHEILGAAERAVDLAVDHAVDREQFGQPIGGFQAVRHLLAWAKTDCVAIDAVVRKAIASLADPPARFDEVVKALAGRNGRRACERSLQVLGGIGFTAEHPHHHHHSRVLLLDAVLGTSSELRRDLGTWLRSTGDDPGYPAALLDGPGSD